MIIYGTKQTVERYGMKMPEDFQDVYRKINGKWRCGTPGGDAKNAAMDACTAIFIKAT